MSYLQLWPLSSWISKNVTQADTHSTNQKLRTTLLPALRVGGLGQPTHIYGLLKILTDTHTQCKPKTVNNPAGLFAARGLG